MYMERVRLEKGLIVERVICYLGMDFGVWVNNLLNYTESSQIVYNMTSFFTKILPVLIILPAIYLYFACVGHYEWIHLQQGNSNIDYPAKYQGLESKFSLQVIEVPVDDSHDSAIIHTWLMKSKDASDSVSKPLVVMSHGLGSQKDMGLLPYAEKFCDDGFAVVMMDYRYFGGSSNSDKTNFRNLIDPWNHVSDIQTVLNAIINKHILGSDIDTNNIILWGTSFAGGHMLRVANNENNPLPNIKAVISQVPHLDGKAASLRALKSRGIAGFMRVMALALSDILLQQVNKLGNIIGVQFNLPSIYVKIVGTAADSAYMVISDNELTNYFAKHPAEYLGGWKNLAPARTLAYMSLYSPIQDVPTIKVPILFVAATNDTLCPIEYVRTAAEQAVLGQLMEINTTHFELYSGENFARISARMVDFAKTHVKA